MQLIVILFVGLLVTAIANKDIVTLTRKGGVTIRGDREVITQVRDQDFHL